MNGLFKICTCSFSLMYILRNNGLRRRLHTRSLIVFILHALSSQLVSLPRPAPPVPPPGLIRVAYRSTHEGFLGRLARASPRKQMSPLPSANINSP